MEDVIPTSSTKEDVWVDFVTFDLWNFRFHGGSCEDIFTVSVSPCQPHIYIWLLVTVISVRPLIRHQTLLKDGTMD